MSDQFLENKYQDVKKTIVTITPTCAVALIGYARLIENPTLGTNSIIIAFSICACTCLLWIAEIIDC